MRKFSVVFSAAILFTFLVVARGFASDLLAEKYAKGDFELAAGGKVADIYIDAADYKVVRIAADALAGDLEAVSGVKPRVSDSASGLGKNVVIIGTLEKCGAIKKLVADKKLDVSKIDGGWEMYLIAVVDKPMPGVETGLVVAGSDRRGAVFGAFELSAAAGVSPWVWWADVAPSKKASLVIKGGATVFGPPSVKYRGIFLNDEDFGLKPWAAKTYEPETGDIGPKTYAKMFELLLRLKANYMWPAMHKCTKAFNYYDKDKFVADDYAIVMGSSHCEQMLRNNVDEWDFAKYGEWSYVNNKENLLGYWDERVRVNGQFENVYTIGMRAIHDSAMPDGKTTEERVALLDRIIKDQREMLAKHVNPDVTKVPQIFVPYKEVLDIYWGGLKVPEDVTIVWPDDNFGYIRRLPTEEERKRPGGNGVYYHISYWGPPHDYLWLNTTPPALIWEEMNKAYAYGAQRLWVLNVGDLKPGEIGTELFLQMAWDIGSRNIFNIDKFLKEWAAREFGAEYAGDIADLMNEYYTLNYQRKPEHMGFYDKYQIGAQNSDPEFSLYTYGDEAQKRIDAFDGIEKKASVIYEKLPAEKKDAYYELVLYPVRGTSLMNKKHLYAYKSRRYTRQGRASADTYAVMAADAQKQLNGETEYYNETLAGGKWRHMMSDHPNDLPVFRDVKTGKAKPSDSSAIGVAIEGAGTPVEPVANSGAKASVLPQFNKFTKKSYFIDIFNRSSQPAEWKAVPVADWILLSKTSGKLGPDERIYVDVDFDKAPKGDNVEGTVKIAGAGSEYEVKLSVFNPGSLDIKGADFVQDNGVISINATNLRKMVSPIMYESEKMNIQPTLDDIESEFWNRIPGLGRTGASITVTPLSAPTLLDPAEIVKKAAGVEAFIYVFDAGEAKVNFEAIPTHEINAGRVLKVGVSIDEGTPVLVEFAQAHDEVNETGKKNVFRNMMEGSIKMKIDRGPHMLKVWGVDPSVILDKIIIDFGGLKKSYLGPEETRSRSY